jgi:hypothetical protein
METTWSDSEARVRAIPQSEIVEYCRVLEPISKIRLHAITNDVVNDHR